MVVDSGGGANLAPRATVRNDQARID